jgi:putative inorganic carbon (HCO3(-)) transporter
MGKYFIEYKFLSVASEFLIGFFLSVYVLLAPWYSIEFTGALYDNNRFLELLFLIMVAVPLLFLSDWRFKFLYNIQSFENKTKSIIVSLFILLLISAIHSEYKIQAFQEISLFFLLLIFAFSCHHYACLYPKSSDYLFVFSVLIGAFLFVIKFIIFYQIAGSVNSAFSWISPFVNFSNVRVFSHYQALTLPILIIPCFLNIPLRWQGVAFFLLALWWALHFATGTRSVWVALIGSMLFLKIFLREKSNRWLSHQIFAMLLGGVIYGVFRYLSDDSNRFGMDTIFDRGTSSSGRWELWKVAFELIKEHPFLGVGPMHFSFNNFEIAASPHNSILHIASEYGVPSLLAVIYLIFFILKRAVFWCVNCTNEQDLQINISLTASFICGLVDSMFGGNIIVPPSQLIFFMIGGWLVGRNDLAPELIESELKLVSRWHKVLFVSSLILAIMIQVIGVKDYYAYMTGPDVNLPIYAHPRFWHDGHWPVGIK